MELPGEGWMKYLCAIAILLMIPDVVGLGYAQSDKGCLAYEPTVEKIIGRIISRTFPGPPEYESIKRGDEPDTYWFLALPRPVCVDGGDPEEVLIDRPQHGIRRIQLVFSSEHAYVKYKHLLGKRVVATGMLYGSFTIHHKTPVLLEVNTLALAK
jgi:hypothetical protein